MTVFFLVYSRAVERECIHGTFSSLLLFRRHTVFRDVFTEPAVPVRVFLFSSMTVRHSPTNACRPVAGRMGASDICVVLRTLPGVFQLGLRSDDEQKQSECGQVYPFGAVPEGPGLGRVWSLVRFTILFR